MMKTLMMTATLLAASTSFADTLVCSSTQTPAKVSVTLKGATKDGSAVLKISDDEKAVKLKCSMPVAYPRTSTDQMYQIAMCNDGIADAGYYVSIDGGGFAGITVATVYSKKMNGSKVVAKLYCQNKK